MSVKFNKNCGTNVDNNNYKCSFVVVKKSLFFFVKI